MTKGRKAIGDFLQKLQIYKSLGDFESASKMYEHYSTVSDELEYPYLKFRDVTLLRKKPRRLFVESSTELVGSTIQLKTFDTSCEGMILSFQNHLSGESNIDSILVDLWKKDSNYFV